MDWKQFIANIVGSLAWPGVLVVLLILVRKQLAGLAERLQELSLPGGAKAIFVKNLESARKDAEALPPEERPADRIIPEGEQRRLLRLVNEFPEAAIVETFKNVETLLFQLVPLLDLKGAKTPITAIEELHKRKLIDGSTRDLFYTLRSARNAAAHVSADKPITPGEALDYGEHAAKLSARLSYLIGYLGARKETDPADKAG